MSLTATKTVAKNYLPMFNETKFFFKNALRLAHYCNMKVVYFSHLLVNSLLKFHYCAV